MTESGLGAAQVRWGLTAKRNQETFRVKEMISVVIEVTQANTFVRTHQTAHVNGCIVLYLNHASVMLIDQIFLIPLLLHSILGGFEALHAILTGTFH